ncbi:MAG TPA: O-antigen ligase family protein [Ignavibacteriaceae bacterium]|nr:O-antigen ligase family protein [Ignavibacteriaceae bacterium]
MQSKPLDKDLENYFIKYLRIISLTLIMGMFVSSAVVQICIALFFPATITIYVQKFRNKHCSQMDWLLLFMFLSGVASVLLSTDSRLSFHSLPRHGLLLTAIPLSFLFNKDESISLKFVFFLIAAGGFISGFAGTINYFSTGERAYGLFAGYYTLASLLTFSSLISFGLLFSVPAKFSIAIVFSLLVQLTALWFTYTRSAYLGVIIGLIAGVLIFYYFFKKNNLKSKFIPAALFVAIAILILISVFSNDNVRINPISIFNGDQKQNDFSSGRLSLYMESAKVFSSNWENAEIIKLLLGRGLNSRMIIYPESSFTSWESDYIESFMNQGLIGVILLIAIYYIFFQSLVKTLKPISSQVDFGLVIGILMAGVGFWIISFFSSQMIGQNSSAYFAIMIASFEKLKTDFINN